MNKITLQELVLRLINETGASRKFSEELIHALPEIIEEGLLRDGRVKINGLGTFRLKWVKARVGRNLKTGERIDIPPHNKVVFTPDDKMQDIVNQEYKFLTYKTLGDKKAEKEPEPVRSEKPAPAPVPEQAPQDEVTMVEEIIEEATPEEKPPPPPPVKSEAPKTASKDEPPRKKYMWLIPVFILIVLVLFVIFYFRTCQKTSDEPEKQPTEQVIAPAEDPDTIAVEPEPVVKKELPRYKVEGAHTMGAKDYFFQLARQHYGEPLLWVLIYKANMDQVDDPEGNIYGKTFVIPPLEGDPDNLTRTDSMNVSEGYRVLYEYYDSQGDEVTDDFLFATNRYRPN